MAGETFDFHKDLLLSDAIKAAYNFINLGTFFTFICLSSVGAMIMVSYTCSKNDVISSVRKHYCALGLRLAFGLRLEIGLRVSGNTFSVKRIIFEQVYPMIIACPTANNAQFL